MVVLALGGIFLSRGLMAFSANASGWWADMNERLGFTQALARWKMACKKYNLISRHVVHKKNTNGW